MFSTENFRIGGVIRLAILAVMVVVVSLFTFANRHWVRVDGWPLDFEITAPMAVVVLLSVFFGLVLGSLLMSEPIIKYRLRAKRAERRATALEYQMAQSSGTAEPDTGRTGKK
ncbi:MAG: lipopolysaccharide assembly protein LapA domain-containing protein [Candidatus Pacebacteria bacterium]|nr:lipopolysaccharide assembly protein LapA domain-containing protein [Candidatus Paceibacterota bacterium]